MFQHLLVALDGSELANKALKVSLELAKAHNSKVTIVTSTDPINTGLGTGGFGMIDAASIVKQLEQIYAAQAKQILDAAKVTCSETGIDADTIYVPRQRAGDSILETAEKVGCDLIIMGSHGRQGLQKLLLGSQAAAVLAASKDPVLIVK
jgi:nucleotide-binding universal stress UspA family protein